MVLARAQSHSVSTEVVLQSSAQLVMMDVFLSAFSTHLGAVSVQSVCHFLAVTPRSLRDCPAQQNTTSLPSPCVEVVPNSELVPCAAQLVYIIISPNIVLLDKNNSEASE